MITTYLRHINKQKDAISNVWESRSLIDIRFPAKLLEQNQQLFLTLLEGAHAATTLTPR